MISYHQACALADIVNKLGSDSVITYEHIIDKSPKVCEFALVLEHPGDQSYGMMFDLALTTSIYDILIGRVGIADEIMRIIKNKYNILPQADHNFEWAIIFGDTFMRGYDSVYTLDHYPL